MILSSVSIILFRNKESSTGNIGTMPSAEEPVPEMDINRRKENTQSEIETQPVLASNATNYGESSFDINDFKLSLSNGSTCLPRSTGVLHFCDLGYQGENGISHVSGGKYVDSVVINPDKLHPDKWTQYRMNGRERVYTTSGDSIKHAKLKKTIMDACNDYASVDCSPYTGTPDFAKCTVNMKQKCLKKATTFI